MTRDALVERVEREMREAFSVMLDDGCTTPTFGDFEKAAAGVAVRLIREWGHVAGCRCGPMRMGLGGAEVCYDSVTHLPIVVRDPRCAPTGEGNRE